MPFRIQAVVSAFIGCYDWDSPFVVLVLQGLHHMRGDLIHQVIRLPRVQDAGESAHLAIHPLLLLALLAHLPVPVIIPHICSITQVDLGREHCVLMQLICRMHVGLLVLQSYRSCLHIADCLAGGMLPQGARLEALFQHSWSNAP